MEIGLDPNDSVIKRLWCLCWFPGMSAYIFYAATASHIILYLSFMLIYTVLLFYYKVYVII